MDKLMKLLVFTACVLVSFPVFADEEEGEDASSEMRSRVVTDDEVGARFFRPEGWVTGKTREGIAAVFHAAGDQAIQIEVRVSSDIGREDGDYFFATFDSQLQEKGFKKSDEREEATHGEYSGRETEYEVQSDGDTFRLIVWKYHHDDTVIMVVGFFPEHARDEYYEDFASVIETMELD